MPATVPSLRVTKSFPFKGATREYSNRYHFLGGTPGAASNWKALMDAVVQQESLLVSSDTHVVSAIGYAAGSDLPVHTELYNTPGALSPGAGVAKAPGEVAALLRFSTNARSIKNHPIYCFNYFHDVFVDTAALGQDTLSPNQHSTILGYGNQWISGFSDGFNQLVRSSPHGALCSQPVVETYVTHRDFPPTRST
jgi:hypothetical protein